MAAASSQREEAAANFFVPRRQPREHQARALEVMKGKASFALLQAMRTGKTYVAINDWARLVEAGEASDLLVVGPNGALPPWMEALRDDLPEALLRRTLIYPWSSAKANQQASKALRKTLLQAPSDVPRILLVNVEAISHVALARELCETFLRQRPGRSMMVVDESVCIKAPTSICGKFCVNVLAPLAAYRRILTGLVTPRSPLDLFQQFAFLDKRILRLDSYWAFKHRYAVLKKIFPFNRAGRGVEIVVGYRNVAELSERIAPHSFRVRLEDVYDMPASDYSFRDVELTSEQRKIYDDIREHACAKLESSDHVTASQVIVQMLRMHQVLCGHVKDENGEIHDIKEKRVEALLDLLRDYDGKAVIWCSYDHDVRKVSEAIAKEFKEAFVSRFWGGNSSTREDEERRFKSDPRCRFMVATPDAGGKGRTWSMADLVVYFSSRNNLDLRQQSEERVKAQGKTTPIAYVDLRAPGTVDERIIGALRKKIDLATQITGDDYRDWLI